MHKLIAIREDLKSRRERLHEKAEAIEQEIRKLNSQIEDLDFYIQNTTGVRESLPKKAVEARPMTTKQLIVHFYKGDENGFTARELIAAAQKLPVPVHLRLESVRSLLSSMKCNRELKTYGFSGGQTLYVLP